MNKFLQKHKAIALKGEKFENLIENYIDKGHPLLVWATIGMEKPEIGDSWIVKYADENAHTQVGKKYTYNYLIPSKNKYYCTNLVTRIANKIDVKLNYDLFIATGNDIIISNDTFIVFVVKKVDLDNKKINVYYMKEA